MQIEFDVWMSEQKLNDEGFDQRAISLLKEKGLTYELDGALWLKTTSFGDDKDRVLIKKDGKNAYIAGDCGYMLNKIERGYSRLIMGLGADHHGYVSRIKAVASALGFVGDFRIIISQLVRLVKDGKEARMSKRAGNVINLDDLIDEIGHDVTRFFFLMYSPDTHMNFDLGLAKERSSKNPVYYVQYAHARTCSILEKANEEVLNANFELLIHEKELSLIKELNKFPQLVEEISLTYEVHKFPQYAMRLADKFHSFYDACRVIDEDDVELTKARLSLVNAVRIVLADTLNLIGVSAPEKM
jgi:arginyl-tRNA synthetase